MRNGISPIIIDNTNLHAWEMKPYAVMVGRSIILNFQLRAFCEKSKLLFFSHFLIFHNFILINSSLRAGKEVLFSCSSAVQWLKIADMLISPQGTSFK